MKTKTPGILAAIFLVLIGLYIHATHARAADAPTVGKAVMEPSSFAVADLPAKVRESATEKARLELVPIAETLVYAEFTIASRDAEIARLKAENDTLKKQLAYAQSQPRPTITFTSSPVDGRSYFAISPPLSDLVFRVGIDEPAHPVIAPFTGTAAPESVPAPYVLTPNTGL